MEKKLNYTPEALLNKKFSGAEKGYDPLEVDQTFDQMIEDYNSLLEELNNSQKKCEKQTSEISAYKVKLDKIQEELSRLQRKFESMPKSGINDDNYTLLKKVSAYERVLYKKGIDPKKALSDPDNC